MEVKITKIQPQVKERIQVDGNHGTIWSKCQMTIALDFSIQVQVIKVFSLESG